MTTNYNTTPKVTLTTSEALNELMYIKSSGSNIYIWLIDITQASIDSSIYKGYSLTSLTDGANVVSHTFGNFLVMYSGSKVWVANGLYCYDNGGGQTGSCLACGARNDSSKCTQCHGLEILETSGNQVDVIGYPMGTCRAPYCTAG